MAKIPRVPVENQITTRSVVKITIKFSLGTIKLNLTSALRQTNSRFFFSISDKVSYVSRQSNYLYSDAVLLPSPFGSDVKGSFSCKRGFSLLNFERGLKKNYGLLNLEALCSYYSLLETATVLILCKNIESFLKYDCSKWDILFLQR